MKRTLCSLLFVLLLAVCIPQIALAMEFVNSDTALEDGYYYLIAPNGQILGKNDECVFATWDYSAAQMMYICKNSEGYSIAFANDKRLLTADASDDTNAVSFCAQSWNGKANQRFQLAPADDLDQYILLADSAHAVVTDDITGILTATEYTGSNMQAWSIQRADAEAAADTLPMVSIELESIDNWESKEDIRYGRLTYSDVEKDIYFDGEISIGFRGNSSLLYPKKNYTIRFQEEGYELLPQWGKQKEYCLKANYTDPVQAGNVVSANLAAQINKAYGLYENTPNYGQVDGFPVWLTLNGKDIGLYTWNIPKAEWMLGMDAANPNHLLIGCEGWHEEYLMRDENYELGIQWSVEIGEEDSITAGAFERLVHFVVTADDATFKRNFEKYLNLDACLNYWCYICISNAIDNTSNNLLLATWDGKIWYPLLYDLDACWGIRPGGLEPVYVLVYSRGEYNCRLLERIRDLFPEELKKRYAELRSDVMDEENIKNAFYSFVEQIPAKYYLKDWQMWNPDGVYVQSLDLMERRMKEYLPEVDGAFGYSK